MKFEKGKVFDLEKSIVYAEGGVVSKELVHTDFGSVTLFSFDEGQGLSPHQAPYDALVSVLDGQMELTVDGQKNVLTKGENFIIPAGALHAVYAPRRFKMELVMIHNQEGKGDRI
ncbi:MAG: cupin domain-containing protein [Prevotella sp.]|nr:cupin domain-containing protein [Prevotella sp.]MCH3992779.1 cupin domain-containing protein [Prevotella sp.]MCH4185880.1 cupin domain-containing protein [Prevotella sp.]MCH4215229.1 cupin domain-containing protein [Prevotella sp.]MCH4250639.1 cupin domain-containing protein [Prevotella sp.]MCI1472844.1 cupin domain-containing protein [Prevotella sp.]